MKDKNYCGFIPILGHPNVGKSTLFNQLLGQKISITSCKPQTTRQRITGISTEGVYQAIYVDTPGIHIKEKHVINRFMNKAAMSSIDNTSLIIFIVEATQWTQEDNIILNKLRYLITPVILVINKIDNCRNKSSLLPYINFLIKKMKFIDVVPISAKKNTNIDIIANIVHHRLPIASHLFPDNYITNLSQRFIVSEIIREKLMRFLGEELPYSVAVKIENFNYRHGIYDIYGLIIVERINQKKIVIGNKGLKMKTISIAARQDIENILETKVNLKLWVKVKYDWTNNKVMLRNLGL
ncbi:GTPase Era [Candidatus Profftia lariciata]|uniref:GTPase Era n=1 Tax=Candidatus Profftia lariciata TaxID=1987921 RepID=UPI001D007818|nr:GTPase Era [Candidatus Profftia lariciata]UDG81260.1 GTPase Era [Candidatus Profftia lariciata]